MHVEFLQNMSDTEDEENAKIDKAALKRIKNLEKTRDTLRYKTSKKRCNLYVKNFPNQWPKEELENLF